MTHPALLKMLEKYALFIEQPDDATEPQAGTDKKEIKLDGTDSENEVDLSEIFPLYQSLILKALKHKPSDQELLSIDDITSEMADVDPKNIVDSIELMLGLSSSDASLRDTLSKTT